MTSPATVRAICLHQPYASLVADGVKTIETRTWATSYRGPFVICSTKALAHPHLWKDCLARVEARGARQPNGDPYDDRHSLPRGFALGMVWLADCREMTKADEEAALISCTMPTGAVRYAWVLDDSKRIRFREPVPVTGRQSWFSLPLSSLPEVRLS
jgi:hypothetical protein